MSISRTHIAAAATIAALGGLSGRRHGGRQRRALLSHDRHDPRASCAGPHRGRAPDRPRPVAPVSLRPRGRTRVAPAAPVAAPVQRVSAPAARAGGAGDDHAPRHGEGEDEGGARTAWPRRRCGTRSSTKMTDRRTGALPVVAAAAALFCLVLVYLALQVRAGLDPAIGAGHQAQAQVPRQVVVRRVIVRRVIVDPPKARRPAPAAVSAPARGWRPRPAPAPAAAPAPRGAARSGPGARSRPGARAEPAPVVTRAS